MGEMVPLLINIRGEPVTGTPIKAISFYDVNIDWARKLFFTITPIPIHF